jgi:hypothetical protein
MTCSSAKVEECGPTTDDQFAACGIEATKLAKAVCVEVGYVTFDSETPGLRIEHTRR